ncbi:hypothetical protein HYW40_00770 [Candidatus Curtissbacteria bacterium]|nr:hypothetical protein [Candidatus Curtissbacteria bacterium]
MIVETALAKLDLAIHINPRKKDGLYPVDYVDCQLDIGDKLSFFPKQSDIEIVCNNPDVPVNLDNFIYKAAVILKKTAGNKNLGAKIVLEKQIPVKAGFGGGPADGAAAVRGLCRLWRIKFSKGQIQTISKSLGKDFFYSMYGGLGEVGSRGKDYKFRKIDASLPKFHLVVLVPKRQKPSTGWIYEHLKAEKLGKSRGLLKGLIEAIAAGDRAQILANLHNDFEDMDFQFSSQIDRMKRDLAGLGAGRSLMAGAGLAVVGFFDTKARADRARKALSGKYQEVYLTKPLEHRHSGESLDFAQGKLRDTRI